MRKLLVFFSLAGFLLGQEYCVQVASSDISNKNSLIKKAKDYFTSFPYTRVEQIGKYYVLRVGRYKSYRNAWPMLRSIKRYVSSAFIRKCDWIPSRIVYPSIRFKENFEEGTKIEKVGKYHLKNEKQLNPLTKKKEEVQKEQVPTPIFTKEKTNQTVEQDRNSSFKPSKPQRAVKTLGESIQKEKDFWDKVLQAIDEESKGK